MNWIDALIIAALAVALGLAARRMIADRRRGKRCGCDCASCTSRCDRREKRS